MKLRTIIATALGCLVVFALFVPLKQEIIVLEVTQNEQLTQSEQEWINKHPDEVFVNGKNNEGKMNHYSMKKSDLSDKTLPALATKKESICGCVYSLNLK